MSTSAELPPGYRLIALDEVVSTNDEAKRLAVSGAGEGTVIWARSQRGGRGRRGRAWISPPGNLYLSIILRPECAPSEAAQLSFVAVVALGETLEPLLPSATALKFKWPNDVMISGRKVSGILLETATTGWAALEWVVVGVGLNVSSHPTGISAPATSLLAESAEECEPTRLIGAYCRNFKNWYDRWREGGFPPLRAAWLQRAMGIGEQLQINLEGVPLAGKAVALDAAGALIVETTSGERRAITAGEVFFGGDG